MSSRKPKSERRGFSRSDWYIIQQLVRYLRPYKLLFSTGFVALIFASALNLFIPEIVRRMLEPQNYHWVLDAPRYAISLLLFVFGLQAVFTFVRYYSFSLVGQRVLAAVRNDLFSSLIRSDMALLDASQSSDLTSRLINDAALVQDAVSVRFSVVIRYTVQVLVGVGCMAWLSLVLTTATAVSILLLVLISFALAKGLRKRSRDQQELVGAASIFASENLSGVRTIRSLSTESNVEGWFRKHVDDIRRIGENRAHYAGLFASGMSFLLYSLLSALLVFGISLVNADRLLISELAAFVLYGAIVAGSFSFLISGYTELVQSLGGLTRVFERLHLPPLVPAAGIQSKMFLDLPVGIRIQEVSFAYASDKDEVLRELTLNVLPSSTTALVGVSGSGKSSLVALILGFYRPTKGSIDFFSDRHTTIEREGIRIGWVPQEPVLFSQTVEQNLRYADPGATNDELEWVCRIAGCLEVVTSLSEGFKSKIGEKGVSLSGGQRQRLALARTLLMRPQILVLDEATSGLDSETEDAVSARIREFLPTVTILLISHRLATVKRADTIAVIDSGRLVQQGSHMQLTGEDGPYREHAKRQNLELRA